MPVHPYSVQFLKVPVEDKRDLKGEVAYFNPIDEDPWWINTFYLFSYLVSEIIGCFSNQG